MNIGFLGGTFDPIHAGHLKLGLAALRQCRLDRVYFAITPCSPFKSRNRPTPVRLRLSLLRKALQKTRGLRVGLWEVKKRHPPYTVNTLRFLKKKWPGHKIFLVLGSDALAGFTRWKNWSGILQMATLVIGRRPGFPVRGRALSKAPFVLLRGRFPLLSSTAIREKLASKPSRNPGLPVGVWNAIKKSGLYGLS